VPLYFVVPAQAGTSNYISLNAWLEVPAYAGTTLKDLLVGL